MDTNTYEKNIDRELDDMLVTLKKIENKFLSETSKTYVSISDICDIFAIHLAVLRGYDDMSEALEFIQRMYTRETMQNKNYTPDSHLVLYNNLSNT